MMDRARRGYGIAAVGIALGSVAAGCDMAARWFVRVAEIDYSMLWMFIAAGGLLLMSYRAKPIISVLVLRTVCALGALCWLVMVAVFIRGRFHLGHTATDIGAWEKSAILYLTAANELLLLISFFVLTLAGVRSLWRTADRTRSGARNDA